ncbi:MAG: hypothetical protein ACYSU8_06620, partial [Planctomycetota bacterium]
LWFEFRSIGAAYPDAAGPDSSVLSETALRKMPQNPADAGITKCLTGKETRYVYACLIAGAHLRTSNTLSGIGL